jgi:hypothetical protein
MVLTAIPFLLALLTDPKGFCAWIRVLRSVQISLGFSGRCHFFGVWESGFGEDGDGSVVLLFSGQWVACKLQKEFRHLCWEHLFTHHDVCVCS